MSVWRLHSRTTTCTRPSPAHMLLQLHIDDQNDGCQQERCNAKHDDLVGDDALGHGAQDLACLADVVVSTVQRVARMRDGLALPRQVLQDAHAQLLHSSSTDKHRTLEPTHKLHAARTPD